MGVGRALVRGLGAAMQGLGEGMILQETANERRRESEAARMWDLALTRERQRLNEESADRQVGRNLDQAKGVAAIEVGAHAARLKTEEPYKVREGYRGEARDARKDARDAREWQRRLEASANSELAQAQRKRALGLDASAPNAEIDDYLWNPQTGSVTVVFKDGSTADTPLQPLPKAGDGAGSVADIPRRGGQGAKPAGATAAQAPPGAPRRVKPGEVFRMADGRRAKYDERGNLIVLK